MEANSEELFHNLVKAGQVKFGSAEHTGADIYDFLSTLLQNFTELPKNVASEDLTRFSFIMQECFI